MSVLHENMCTFKSGLSSLRHIQEKHKDEVPDILG